LFERFRTRTAADRLLEEQLYEQVVIELQQGQKRPGLWAKALVDSNGSEQYAKSLYIQYRVQSIRDEMKASLDIAEQERQKAAAKAEEDRRREITKNQEVVTRCKRILQSKGYQFVVTESGAGWLILDPSGACTSLKTLEQLQVYAKSKH
jgi:hypothetical protein